MNKILHYLLISILILILSCSSKEDNSDKTVQNLILAKAALDTAKGIVNPATGTNGYDSVNTYFSTMTQLNLQVVYESNASPYAGSFTNPFTATTKNVWDILDNNLQEIFKNRATTVTTSVPKVLSSMTSISSLSKTTWTTTEIINLAKQYRTSASSASTGNFIVFFVNGYYSTDGSSQSTNVIGVSISNTPYIMIFKQVVNSTGDSTPAGIATKIYVEQSTLVHEMGHALGLVNNGVTLTSQHQDTSNGKHCTDTTCVMYYANEGTTALVNFLQNFIQTGSTILFTTSCLNDTQSYFPL